MGSITLIAAIGRNGELGYDNKLIWHLKEDMKFFKDNTMGKPIVMGINTLKSLPKLLPEREHIVLTHQNIDIEGVKVFNDKDKLLEYIDSIDKEFMIIGGASIYSQFIEYAQKMLLTRIDESAVADTYFPQFDVEKWSVSELGDVQEGNVRYKHLSYIRNK